MALKNLLPALFAITPILGSPVRTTVAEKLAHRVIVRDDTCVDARYANTDVVSNDTIS